MRKRLFWQLYPSFLIIILMLLITAGVYATESLKRFYLLNLQQDLKARAELAMELIAEHYLAEDSAMVDHVVKRIGERTQTRYTAILPDGEVIGDSLEDPAKMDNHGSRPEIKKALTGEVGMRTRYSKTIGEDLMYVAIPVRAADGAILGVMRASVQVKVISQTLKDIYDRLVYGGLAISFIAALVSIFIAQRIGKPIQEIRRGAEEFAAGNLSYRLDVSHIEEVSALADTMNQMAAQLYERISTITQQRNELEAVLSSMVEAVLAFDVERRIIWYNHAAQRLFNIEPDSARHLKLADITQNESLLDFSHATMGSTEPVEGNLILERDGEQRHLQANGANIRDAKGQRIGGLIVLNDITRIIRLEKVRQDFVANVSHELKTPITSIKGFVETLKNGAINDVENATNFLDIIGRHSDRLTMIIEDLLSLSRIEQDAENEQIELDDINLLEVIQSAVQFCENRAAAKNSRIEMNCSGTIVARINAHLLEQAVINLIDNAVKYSPEESLVTVTCARADVGISISVADQGRGIPAEDLPRIFERFYRVDKARSRKLGGTGLGLSIVKHIAQAHNGRVVVDSDMGKGSTFIITLPNA